MYLDSCIVVKLLVPEPDSGTIAPALRGQPLTTSELATTEVHSALLTRERLGGLKPADRKRALAQFREWIRTEEVVLAPLDSRVLKRATQMLEKCHPAIPLRTLDSIHLATADLVQDGPLCTTDRRLRDAAGHLGLELFPPA